MSRSKSLLLGVSLLLVAGASSCSKGKAETALKAAESVVEEIRPDAEAYAPEEFTQLTDAVQSARDMFNNGDYAGALATAQGIPAKAEEIKQMTMAKKEAMTKEWSDLQASVPGMVQSVTAKVNELGTGKLPKGMSKDEVAECQTKLDSANRMWNQAALAAQAGQIKTAVESGRETRAIAEELMTKLGITEPAGA